MIFKYTLKNALRAWKVIKPILRKIKHILKKVCFNHRELSMEKVFSDKKNNQFYINIKCNKCNRIMSTLTTRTIKFCYDLNKTVTLISYTYKNIPKNHPSYYHFYASAVELLKRNTSIENIDSWEYFFEKKRMSVYQYNLLHKKHDS